jgi:hypothetical protein
MRDVTNWKRILVERLGSEGGLTRQQASLLCDVELGLFLIEELLPSEAVATLPAILSGYQFPTSRATSWTAEQRRMLAVGRQLLRYYQGRRRWRQALSEYTQIPSVCRLYGFTSPERAPTPQVVSVCTDRQQQYAQALRSRVPHRKTRRVFADPGLAYEFEHRDVYESVTFPGSILGRVERRTSVLRQSEQRVPLSVPWHELLATAEWMDTQELDESWRARMDRMQLLLFGDDAQPLSGPRALQLEGVCHLVGMVGSGKSTLMDVLAVWAARKGMRSTLVVGDVTDAVRRATLFTRLGISAVPVLGVSDRARHLDRIHRLLRENGRPQGLLPEDDPQLQWFSPVCFVDGLWQGKPALQTGEEPCHDLRGTDGSKERVLCPLIPACPVHRAENELPEALIWITTPAGLVYTRAPRHLWEENIRMLELVYRESDLIVVDEADRVQIRLDDIFSPTDTLVGLDGNGWLDRLGRASAPLLGRNRGQYLTVATHRWNEAQRIAQQAADLLYTLLLHKPRLQKWVQQEEYFTGLSLLVRLAKDLSTQSSAGEAEIEEDDLPIEQALVEEFERFLDDPLGEDNESRLADITRQVVLASGSERAYMLARDWLQGVVRSDGLKSDLEDKLILAVVAGVLDDRLKTIVDHWDAAEDAFNLESQSEWFFRRPPRDYGPLIPESPMGNLFGFRYLSGEESTGSELQFFRCAGIGRWLLLHLHDLFEDLDGIPGPHVLLMSGTSWAPGSSSYHIQLAPHGVLQSPESEVAEIQQSHFTFEPAYTAEMHPIRVSGRSGESRDEGIQQLLHYFAGRSDADGRTPLARELERLQPERARALLIVGSYREASLAARYLDSLPDWRGKALALVPDEREGAREDINDDGILSRGLVSRFADRPERILIAPLLAIERGHNILTPAGYAAIGSVYFLVRPMPVPHSLKVAVQRMNFWALQRLGEGEVREKHQGMDDRPLLEVWMQFRKQGRGRWRDLMGAQGYYTTLSDPEREEISWTQLVALWQTVGRAIRGEVPVRVHFCDMAFAPLTARGEGRDDAKTSLLLSLRDVLAPYMRDTSEGRLASAAATVAQLLYAPFAHALYRLEGIEV